MASSGSQKNLKVREIIREKREVIFLFISKVTSMGTGRCLKLVMQPKYIMFSSHELISAIFSIQNEVI